MVIYSELTGKQYETVEECLAAEEALKAEIQREREVRRQERKKLESEIEKTYKTLVAEWKHYLKLLEKAEIDVSDLEDKAILFVEIISDAERTEEKGCFRS